MFEVQTAAANRIRKPNAHAQWSAWSMEEFQREEELRDLFGCPGAMVSMTAVLFSRRLPSVKSV